ncbi:MULTISPECIES: peptidase inhibitor family I36 protein [Streptomyces]|jgi:hypothetical protein|uniref:Peptidase inhibitor family I36 protein n=1 Tax=Streptomyces doudnae TaxID=3075536 RepID=A0ABD5EVK8_9ACTN|nr:MULTISPECIES: peptidase inhibitor family I36 protein [unclassified Streptomyces]MDT0438767.1 peptidase inhibitor family I36 protein [Streptomyces sp. DSM 41981]MYQ68807.1 peptidase inhibitor [Streptomyces sp. SID4950]SCE49180.1 Peptidase inhibitor family I36 [Streptomyces sp. SolWspMP-5a-2]
MRRVTSLVITSLALVAALGTAPAVSAAPAPAPAAPAAAAYRCDPGHFCIYSGWDGTGQRCQWTSSRVANTADACGFIRRGRNVRSLWNSTGHRVEYFRQTNFHGRIGSTRAGRGGNLQGDYRIHSFKKQ